MSQDCISEEAKPWPVIKAKWAHPKRTKPTTAVNSSQKEKSFSCSRGRSWGGTRRCDFRLDESSIGGLSLPYLTGELPPSLPNMDLVLGHDSAISRPMFYGPRVMIDPH
jgi:hypothetical protein